MATRLSCRAGGWIDPDWTLSLLISFPADRWPWLVPQSSNVTSCFCILTALELLLCHTELTVSWLPLYFKKSRWFIQHLTKGKWNNSDKLDSRDQIRAWSIFPCKEKFTTWRSQQQDEGCQAKKQNIGALFAGPDAILLPQGSTISFLLFTTRLLLLWRAPTFLFDTLPGPGTRLRIVCSSSISLIFNC